MRELYYCCLEHFKEKMVIGRDRCYELFRSNGLVVRKRRTRPKTTNSNHNYYIYPDLLNTSPKFVASKSGMMVVGDITYVATLNGWAYLSLLTDTASRVIVGYALHTTLETEGPMKALQKAIRFYEDNHIDITELIHHSDRGIQYCSNLYVGELKAHGCRISMTQCGDPLHNAMAERMNNTIKNGWLFDTGKLSFEEVRELVDKAVYAYNNLRPHQALGMKSPMQVMKQHSVA